MTLFGPEAPSGPPGSGADPGAGTRPATDPAPAATVRLQLTVAYDGSGYRGFAPQPGQPTVGGALEDAIATVVRHRVEVVCAGRTDAGVHARGQVVHVDVDRAVDPASLARSLNRMLAPRIAVLDVQVAPEGFDARHSACARRYRYLVYEASVPDPLLAPVSWHVNGPLDLRVMEAAADALLGEHDFRAFCRRRPGADPAEPVVRRVLDARWSVVPTAGSGLPPGARLLRFDIVANAFCHQMVRSVLRLLVEAGRGRATAADVTWLLGAGERGRACDPAPPQGLCLVGVDYRA